MQKSQNTTNSKPQTLHLGMALEYDGYEFYDAENNHEEGDPDAYISASIFSLELYAKKILSSKQPAVKIALTKEGTYRRDQYGNPLMRITQLGKQLIQLRNTRSREELRTLVPCKEFHPRTELIFKILDDPCFKYFAGSPGSLISIINNNKTFGEHLNSLLSDVRNEASKAGFMKKVRDWSARANKNYKSLISHFDGLFKIYARLLFVRIDLGYRIGARDFDNPARIVKNFENFLRNRRSKPKLFGNCVGYAWRLECAPQKGLHYHCIIIFKGSEVQNDIDLANGIGEYWRDSITKDRCGTFWNCNRTVYKRHGIGMINHDDFDKRQTLALMVAPYLTKLDGHMQVSVPKGMTKFRTFGKSELPNQPLVKRGRRRKIDKLHSI